MYLIGQDVAEVINTINQELETLYKWLTQNGVNMEKTKFMIIKSKFNTISNTNHNGIFINGQIYI